MEFHRMGVGREGSVAVSRSPYRQSQAELQAVRNRDYLPYSGKSLG